MGLIIRFLYRTCELPYYTGYRRTDSIRSSSSRIGKNPMRCTVFVGDKLAVARWTPYHKKKKIRGLGRFSSLGGGEGRGTEAEYGPRVCYWRRVRDKKNRRNTFKYSRKSKPAPPFGG